MKCPVDNETLLMTERQGVEIDYCPKCRGIWLDRGELDKLIEVAASKAMPAVTQAEPQRASPPPPPVSEAARSYPAQDRSVSHGGRASERGGFDQSVRHTSVPDPRDQDMSGNRSRKRYDDDDDDYDDRGRGRRKRGMGSILGDIFDF